MKPSNPKSVEDTLAASDTSKGRPISADQDQAPAATPLRGFCSLSLAPNSSAFDARDLGVDFRNLRHDQFVAETITEPKPALQLSAQSV
jgi:hypothetical protein